MSDKKLNRFVALSVCASLVSSLSVLLCMFDNNTTSTILKVIFPLIFWCFWVIELVFVFKADKVRKQMNGNSKTIDNKQRRAGILSFFSNTKAKFADICFLLSVIVETVLVVTGVGDKPFNYLIIFVIIFSFHMHCILNGKNYIYINTKK